MIGLWQKHWKWSPLIAFAVLLVVGLVLFGQTFNVPLICDGYALSIYPIPQSGDLGSFFARPYHYTSFFRPLTTFSLALVNRIAGDCEVVYHVFEFSLHILAALLLFSIFRRLLKDDRWALLGALIYFIHPKVMHTVTQVGDHNDVLSLTLFLVSAYCVLRYSDARDLKKHHRAIWFCVSLMTLYLALLAKETAVVFVALGPLLAWGAAIRAGAGLKTANRQALLLGGGLAGVVGVILLQKALIGIPFFSLASLSIPLTRPFEYMTYLPATPYFNRLIGSAGLALIALPALLFYGLLAWGVIRAGVRGKPKGLRTALSSIPFLSLCWIIFVIVPSMIGQHVWYFYYILPGFCLGAVWLVRRLSRWKRVLTWAVSGAILVYYFVVTFRASAYLDAAGEETGRLYAEIYSAGEAIRSSGRVLVTAAPLFMDSGTFVETPIYHACRTWRMRLEHDLGVRVDYQAGAVVIVKRPEDMDFRWTRESGDIIQTTELNTFEDARLPAVRAAHQSASTVVGEKSVRLTPPDGYPLFALSGDGYVRIQ